MRRLLPFLFGPLLLAQSAKPVEALTAHLRQTALLHGEFRQTRHIAVLSKPLVSTGALVVERDRGVLWQLKKPLALTFVVGPSGILEVGADGKRKAQASKDAPMMAQMGRIMKSLLKGQWSAVEDYFTLKGEGDAKAWRITLDPKPATAAFLKQVRVQGGAFMEKLTVEEAKGDRMELLFQNLRTDLPLSDAENRLLSLQ